MIAPFPWAEAIGFGLGVLKLSPRDFWRMTPRELAYAIKAVRGDVLMPIDRGAFDALMRRYPDRSGFVSDGIAARRASTSSHRGEVGLSEAKSG